MADVTVREYLTEKYALWLDMRTNDDDSLHGSGRRIENASEGITIQIAKIAETAGALNIYLHAITDAQINIENGRFISALYQAAPLRNSLRTDRRPPLFRASPSWGTGERERALR